MGQKHESELSWLSLGDDAEGLWSWLWLCVAQGGDLGQKSSRGLVSGSRELVGVGQGNTRLRMWGPAINQCVRGVGFGSKM